MDTNGIKNNGNEYGKLSRLSDFRVRNVDVLLLTLIMVFGLMCAKGCTE